MGERAVETIPHVNMQTINANGSNVTLRLIHIAFNEFSKVADGKPSVVSLHTAQKTMLEELSLSCEMISPLLAKNGDDEELMAYIPRMTLAGVPVFTDINRSPDEIALIDESDQVLVCISGLAVPQ